MRSRREFVKRCCALTAATAAAPLLKYGPLSAYAQGTSYKALVCVFMFGGNDGNNVVAPKGSGYALYSRGRSSIAIPEASLLSIAGAGGASFGLHPALTGIRNIYANNQRAALLFNVGMLVKPTTKADISAGTAIVPRNLYSHGDQVSQWQTANPLGAGGTGWGGRIADILTAASGGAAFPIGMSLNGSSAQLLNGVQTRPLAVSGNSSFGLDRFGSDAMSTSRETALSNILRLDSGAQMIGAANGILSSAIQGAQQINAAIGSVPDLSGQFPQTYLGQQLAQVARVISARGALGMTRQIFFVGVGGFDTHSDQIASQQNLMAELDAGVTAFYNATQNVADQVTLFTESEFGRTFGPSATAGSDHAWGSHHLIVGGAVRGGTSYGTFPNLAIQGPDDVGDRGSWIPTTSLDQYAGTLASWFGVSAADLASIFPNLANFPTKNLGFV